MKSATKNLENDHISILKLISVMDHITTTNDPDIDHLEEIVSIIKNFADGVHHAKEEEMLFPLLEQKGFSRTSGPVAVMLNEHETGRNYVKGMRINIDVYKNGDKEALKHIYLNMKNYSELLKSHIAKENNILFMMADKVLSEKDHGDLLLSFAAASQNYQNSSFENRIAELADFYNI
ncbi:MAG TPA: hemerythrin domain-containing protein [Bacteroidales bacterium]|nr:hemerythrin domain-containing protein [Bacteroidales bacterium]